MASSTASLKNRTEKRLSRGTISTSTVAALAMWKLRATRMHRHTRDLMMRTKGAGNYYPGEPAVQFENSYRTEPMHEERPRHAEIHAAALASAANYLGGMRYNAKLCARLSKIICDDVKHKVQTALSPAPATGPTVVGRSHADHLQSRYRVVVTTMVSENTGQSLLHVSRCVWNEELDSQISAEYSNQYLLATVVVYLVYLE